MKNIRIIGDKILIKEINEEQKTSEGIIIPDTEKKTMLALKGTVIKAGFEISKVKEGEVVIFSKLGAIEIVIKGEKYLSINEEDIILIITNKK